MIGVHFNMLRLAMAWKISKTMEQKYTTQLQHILECMTVGAAILDCTTLRILYANSYLISFCPEPWHSQGLEGCSMAEVLPADVYARAAPLFRQVCTEGQKMSFSQIPYE